MLDDASDLNGIREGEYGGDVDRQASQVML
jgi:hypothetical protein